MKIYIVKIKLEDGLVESPQCKTYNEALKYKKEFEERYNKTAYIWEYTY